MISYSIKTENAKRKWRAADSAMEKSLMDACKSLQEINSGEWRKKYQKLLQIEQLAWEKYRDLRTKNENDMAIVRMQNDRKD